MSTADTNTADTTTDAGRLRAVTDRMKRIRRELRGIGRYRERIAWLLRMFEGELSTQIFYRDTWLATKRDLNKATNELNEIREKLVKVSRDLVISERKARLHEQNFLHAATLWITDGGKI